MRVLSVLAWIGFGVTLATHLVSAAGIDLTERIFPPVLVLTGLAMTALISLVVREDGMDALPANTRMIPGEAFQRNQKFAETLARYLPAWAQTAVWLGFAYMAFNFVVFVCMRDAGFASQIYSLQTRLLQQLTGQRMTDVLTHLQQANELRNASGYALIMFLVPALFFWFAASRHERRFWRDLFAEITSYFSRADRSSRRTLK